MFYEINLMVLVAINLCLGWHRYRLLSAQNANHDSTPLCHKSREARKFQERFLLAYLLATAADWLQGPHIYAMYKYEKELSEQLVGLLYSVGFVSGAVSAAFAGQLADRHGRRAACLTYCGCYIFTCLSMLSDDLIILILGRIFGGLAATLLSSVFETWMIAEYRSLQLDNSTLRLSTVLGNMTTCSGFVAILSGILGDTLVRCYNSRIWPFLAGVAACAAAAVAILASWRENFGDKSSEPNDMQQLRFGLGRVTRQTPLLTLGIAMCCFEGTMYLFIFFWSSALNGAKGASIPEESPPFGFIFSSFMCSMMLGSAISSLVYKRNSSEGAIRRLTMVLISASAVLSCAILIDDERLLFWAFCAFEFCVGIYFPTIGIVKSHVVDDDIRGSVYSILRLPLNVFVVLAHSLDREGVEHRKNVFLACAGLLLLAAVVVQKNNLGLTISGRQWK